MSKIFEKIKDFVRFNEGDEYSDPYYEEIDVEQYQNPYHDEDPQIVEEEPLSRRRTREGTTLVETVISGNQRGKVIGMPGANNAVPEVVVFEPHSFEEMPQVIQALRERKSVVLNLTIMDPDQAQRAVDFVAGGTYAIDGHQERIGESIFLFAPSCVQVSTQSGVVHEVSQVQRSTVRTAAPAPAWTGESNRIAQ